MRGEDVSTVIIITPLDADCWVDGPVPYPTTPSTVIIITPLDANLLGGRAVSHLPHPTTPHTTG